MNPNSDILLEHVIFILDTELKSKAPYDRDGIESLIGTLLDKLSMERLGPLEWHLATDMRAPGFSFIQPITTSHISGHYFDSPGKFPHLHFDIYSCKDFSWEEIITLLNQYFDLRDWKANLIFRNIQNDREYIEILGRGAQILKKRDL